MNFSPKIILSQVLSVLTFAKEMKRLAVFFLLLLLFSPFCCTNNKSAPEVTSIRANNKSRVLLTENNSSPLAQDSSYTQGVTAIDLNGDFYPEIFATNSWTNDNNFFYQNDNGNFKKDAKFSFARDYLNANGACWGDFTRNGQLDLAVANVNNAPNQIFIALEDSFTRKDLPQNDTTKSWTYGMTWVDATNSGFLDLYAVNYKNQPNVFYKNVKGQLVESPNHVLSVGAHSSLNAVWTDLDNNGFLDVIISGENQNYIFKNMGGYNFEQLTDSPIVEAGKFSYGCSVGDYNNDGFMDLFFTNWDSPNHLYKNKGNWQFEKINSAGISNLKSKTEGSCWGDFDNDGWIDLAVSNDGKNYLYRSLSGEHFEPMSLIGYTDTGNNSNALIFFDSNRSGFLDLYVANGGNQKNQFFENHGNENSWVEIHLKGRKSNSSAIGSKVRVFTGGLKQTKEVSAQSGGGCGGQIPLTLHFGLGQHEKIDSIRVSWTSGRIQSLYNIDSKQLIEILEID